MSEQRYWFFSAWQDRPGPYASAPTVLEAVCTIHPFEAVTALGRDMGTKVSLISFQPITKEECDRYIELNTERDGKWEPAAR